MHTRTNAGFTIIELLVVVAVIAILAAIVAASVSQSRAFARDARRSADLEQVRLALEVFKDTFGRYPDVTDGSCTSVPSTSFSSGGCLEVLVEHGLLDKLPDDPIESQQYFYDTWCRVGPAVRYRMWASGETDHGSTADNWWTDTDIGVTPCEDPS